MSDPQSKEQDEHQNIDDYLNLNSHRQNLRQRRDQELSEDGDYVPQPVDQEENKNQDIELYQPESNLLEEEQQQKYNDDNPLQYEGARPRIVQSAPNEVENGAQAKSQAKKRKKAKKKEIDSQQDEYSGEYSSRRKPKSKDIKKNQRKAQSNRGRGKPRGRGSSSKLREMSIPTYLQDRKTEKDSQKKKSQILVKKPSISFNSNWKVGGEYQQDWDSSNASIYEQSILRRFQCPVNIQLLNLIQTHHERPQELIQSIKKLSSIWYTTLN